MKEPVQAVSLHALFCLISLFSGYAARRVTLLRLQGRKADSLTWRCAGIASSMTIFYHEGVGTDIAWLAWMPSAVTLAAITLASHLTSIRQHPSIHDTSRVPESDAADRKD